MIRANSRPCGVVMSSKPVAATASELDLTTCRLPRRSHESAVAPGPRTQAQISQWYALHAAPLAIGTPRRTAGRRAVYQEPFALWQHG
jgi:hypothetical protein